jgi:ribonuclease III
VPQLQRLIDRLGVPITNQRLLIAALTHSSFLYEHPQENDLMSSERLEFLGDALLNYLAGVLVFERFPDASEGTLSELRALLVKTTTLAEIARDLEIGTYLRLTKGEERSGARDRTALLADSLEAVVAAIYLDGGIEKVQLVILPYWNIRLEGVNVNALRVDYRSVLQERIQAEQGITPRYVVVAESGLEHRREYTIEVLVGTQRLGVGQGHSKQIAGQAAAQAALQFLDR